ncbi:hypothetical protein Mapa_017108 [Marchantia paleacea]|nr:hypothetical protein Mapa_017108 [Marchantia paleacea]
MKSRTQNSLKNHNDVHSQSHMQSEYMKDDDKCQNKLHSKPLTHGFNGDWQPVDIQNR